MIFFSLREVISEIKSDSGFAANITVRCIAQRAEKICAFFRGFRFILFLPDLDPGLQLTFNYSY